RLGDFCYNCGRLGHDVDSCGFERDSAISRIGVGLHTLRFISSPSSQRGHSPSQNTTTQSYTPPSTGNSSNSMQTPPPSQSPKTTLPLLCCESTSPSAENFQSTPHIYNHNLSGSFQVPIDVRTKFSPAIHINSPNNPHVSIYFVTEPAESSPHTPQRIHNELILFEGLQIVEESLSRLSVKRKQEAKVESKSVTKKQKKSAGDVAAPNQPQYPC
ncbi:zinc finger, CCHC-type containing protein, partial [Tanacetum coccineum]